MKTFMQLLLTAALFMGLVTAIQAADVKQTLERTQQVYQQQRNDILASTPLAQREAEQALAKAKAEHQQHQTTN